MRDFAAAFDEIDSTTVASVKFDALLRYFRNAPPADAAWAARLFRGERLPRLIAPAMLGEWATAASGLPKWLVDESHAAVGDLAETIALLMEGTAVADTPLTEWIETRLPSLANASEEQQRQTIVGWWRTLPYRECFVLNKLLTGDLRVSVPGTLVDRALEELRGRAPAGSDRSEPVEASPLFRFDAVLIYASPAEGRRSNLYADYTFGVWHEGELLPVAKLSAHFDAGEISALDRWIRAHTREKFGPVRAVEPSQVFELGCEGISASKRHKSGIALRGPRIVRRRPDTAAGDAATLASLLVLDPATNPAPPAT